MDLKYTPKTIMEIENETGVPLTDYVSKFSMNTIIMFVKKGLDVSKEKAFTEIEEYFADNGDMISLYLTIMEALQRDGFLPKALNIEEVRAKMQNLKV